MRDNSASGAGSDGGGIFNRAEERGETHDAVSAAGELSALLESAMRARQEHPDGARIAL